jgi:hypothetical protein
MVTFVPGLLSGAPVAPAPVPTGPVAPEAEETTGVVAPDQPEFAIPTTLDRAGRVVATVHIDGLGPFRFVVDTGANRSAISETAAQRVGATATQSTLVHGITGSAVMPQINVRELQVGDLGFPQQRLAILPDPVFGGTDGILGIDTLQKARIDIDFVNDRVMLRRSGIANPPDRVIIRATLRHKGLLLIPGKVGRVSVKAIIDTGAERSLGNQALLEALNRKAREPYLSAPTTVIGATGHLEQGLSLLAPPIDLGGTRIGNLVITFGDFHVFRVWSLLDRPALVIGMDVLGTLPEFSIDYPRRQFQLKVTRRLPPIYSGLDSTP